MLDIIPCEVHEMLDFAESLDILKISIRRSPPCVVSNLLFVLQEGRRLVFPSV